MPRSGRFGPSDARLPDPGIAALFEPGPRRQRYLDVEAALAASQADCGVIPAAAAERIVACAHAELLDAGRIADDEARTEHLVVPLVNELARVVGEEHGGWVHWGATSQNIQQTGNAIGLRRAHAALTALLVDALEAMADLGDRTADLVVAGRTHGQQAVPVTFGLKAATWADLTLRNLERLAAVAPRVFTAMAGGAAGTFSAMGRRGPDIQARLAERLGLGTMAVPSRSIADGFAELGCVYGIVAATHELVARQVYQLMSTEIGEAAEALTPGDVGSSTMPQKRNPKLCMEVIGLSARIRALVPLMLEAMVQEHEVDGSRWQLMQDALEDASVLTGAALVRVVEIVRHLRVDPDRMLANLEIGGGSIMAESMMMALAEVLGRQQAHDVIHRTAETAVTTGVPFSQVLLKETVVVEALTPQQIEALLDPRTHTGSSADLVRATSDRARAAVAAFRAAAR